MNRLPLVATTMVFIGLCVASGLRYDGFLSVPVFINLVADNAFLGIAAVGLTFVIISGGIDLSVGSVVGCSAVAAATLLEAGWPGWAVLVLVPILGAMFGGGMGSLIRAFALPPFLVTLAGMFIARGLALTISLESQEITDPFVMSLGTARPLGLPLTAWVFIGVAIGGSIVANFTAFGRNVYAMGGNREAAELMGVPIRRTTVGVYALSGFLAACAGIVFAIYSSSGNATAGTGLELDAIAAVVIGGTLLTGGIGGIGGTVLGVLILGIIQTAITFEGTLSSWWAKIATGVLLLVFVLLQRVLTAGARQRTQKSVV